MSDETIMPFDFPAENPTIIKVIGVGGGGGNAVNHMYKEGIHDVTFVVCNTDNQALAESPVPVKLQLGKEGLGAGNRPERAREAAEESIEDVKGMLNDGCKMVFITAGMGGGTGTGAAPIIAKTAKDMDQAINDALHSPLLNNNDIFNSKKILFNISFSTKSELMMEEMNEVHDFMSKFGKDVETKWGLYIDESLEEQVKFTVLATGFGIKDVPGMDNMMNKRTIEEQKKLEELEEEEQRKDERRGDYYGKDTFKNSNKKKRHNIYIFSLEDLDNDDIISMVETTPTFQRTKTVLESIQSKAIAEEEETFNNDAENGGITITF